jgi:hypothetical protein
MSPGLPSTFDQSTLDTFPSPDPNDGSTDYVPYIGLFCVLSYLAFTATIILRGLRYRTAPEVDIESESGRSLLHDMTDFEGTRDRVTRDCEGTHRLLDCGFEKSLPEYSREYREVDDDALSPPPTYEESRDGWHCGCGQPGCTL